jgi:hypothetical protein
LYYYCSPAEGKNRRLLFIAANVLNDEEGDGDAILVENSIFCSNDNCAKEFSFAAANITEAPVGDWFCPICINGNASSVVVAVGNSIKRPRRKAAVNVSYTDCFLPAKSNSTQQYVICSYK